MYKIALLTLVCTSLQAERIILDQVMSPTDQKKTGVSTLKYQQKLALEDWLNEHCTLKTAEPPEQIQQPLTLSLNIDNGKQLRLSDGSLWQVAPQDIPTASGWLLPFPITIKPSDDPAYPFRITNSNTGVSIRARQLQKPTSYTKDQK